MALALASTCAATAAEINTRAGRMTGAVRFEDGRLRVGDTAVGWEQVVSIAGLPRARTVPPPHAVRLTSGDVFRGRIESLSGGKLKVRLAMFGPREIDVKHVASLDFAADLPSPRASAKHTLLRAGQEPMPGALLWIDDRQLAVDGPLGVLRLPREGTTRYVFAPTGDAPLVDCDEVHLVDGSVLRGGCKPVKGGLQLEHPLLGKLPVPAAALRAAVRCDGTVTFLTEHSPAAATTTSLLGGKTLARVERLGAGSVAARSMGFVRALCIEPRTTVRYALPKRASAVTLRARVEPAAGSRGDVTLRITAGERTLLLRKIAARGKQDSLTVALPADGVITIEVDFLDHVRLPAGVILVDPILLAARTGKR